MTFLNTKFDNYRSSTFGDYLSNKNRDGRRTDKQTNGETDGQTGRQMKMGDLFLLSVGVLRGRENVSKQSADGLDYNTSFV